MKRQEYRKMFAFFLVLGFAGLVLYLLRSLIGGILGAFVLLVLFYPIYEMLRRVIRIRWLAAIIVIAASILIVVLPILLMGTYIVAETSKYAGNRTIVNSTINAIEANLGQNITIERIQEQAVSNSVGAVNWLLGFLITSVSDFFISIVVMYFILFFLLVDKDKYVEGIKDAIPFNEKNSNRVITEFKNFTYSTVYGVVIIAIIQAILLWIGLLIFGIDNSLLISIIGLVVSLIPAVGIITAYVPVGVWQIIQGNTFAGIGILLWGFLIISNVDNIARPMIYKRYANVNPIIAMIGILIGLQFFGIIGIVIGPLLIQYSLLLFKMFKEEYVK